MSPQSFHSTTKRRLGAERRRPLQRAVAWLLHRVERGEIGDEELGDGIAFRVDSIAEEGEGSFLSRAVVADVAGDADPRVLVGFGDFV